MQDWGATVGLQRQLINAACTEQRLNAACAPTEALILPAWLRYELWLGAGESVGRVIGKRREFALRLGCDPARLRIEQEGGAVILSVPRERPGLLRYGALAGSLGQVHNGRGIWALVGIDGQGTGRLLPLTAHCLISATTGAGKSNLLRGMVYWIVSHYPAGKVQMLLIDPKATELRAFVGLPHCAGYAADAPSAGAWLRWVLDQMRRRQAEGITQPVLYVIVDELFLLLQDDAAGGIQEQLTQLVSVARSAGVFLIAGVQRPGAQVCSPMMKANFPIRAVGQQGSAGDAYIAAGQRDSGAEALPVGAFVILTDGRRRLVQAPYLSEQELEEGLRPLRIGQDAPGLPDGYELQPEQEPPEPLAPRQAGRPADGPTAEQTDAIWELLDNAGGDWEKVSIRAVRAILGPPGKPAGHDRARRVIAELRAQG